MEKASKITLMLAFAAISTFLVEPAYGTADDSPIKVLDPQSYPLVGGEWHVRFDVAGSGNLTVSAVNGTTMLVQDQQHAGRASHDLSFLRLIGPDGGLVDPSGAGDGSVTFDEFSGSGTFTVMVHTPGAHHLGFEFGGAVAYASNSATVVRVSSPDAGGPYEVGDIINVTATFSEAVKVKFNPIKGGIVYEELEGAFSVDTVVIGGNTYALVAAFLDDGLQIIDITDPENPFPTAYVTDGVGGFGTLNGVRSVHAVVIDGSTYALVTATFDDGLQIIDITDPTKPSPTASVVDSVDGFRKLDGATTVDTAVIDGSTYALVAASTDDGLQIINITDPANPSPTASVTHGTDGFEVLDGARSVHVVVIGSSTYALVTAVHARGLQIIDITDPENPFPTAYVTDGVGGFEELNGARSADTAVIGGNTYALVAASTDDGLQIINITDPANPSPTASVTDGVDGFEGLDGAFSVHVAVIGGNTYALVAASGDDGLQIIDITDPANPIATAFVTDGVGGFEELNGARSADTAVIDGNTYALVAAYDDNGLQIIDITSPASPVPILPYISLNLELGDGARALYSSGTGTDTLTFQYVVKEGDYSADLAYAGTDALASPGLAKILDNADEEETELALPMPGQPNSLSHSKNIVIDARPPGSVTRVSSPNPDGTYRTGAIINVTATFSEAVKVKFNPIKDGSVYGVLDGATSVHTAVIGGNTYALVAATGDDGIQIIDITDPANPIATASVTDGVGGFGVLGGAFSVDTAVIGGNTYALVAAFLDGGLQIIDITDPANPSPTASVTDGVDGFEGLDDATSVHTAVIGASTYALVSSFGEHGLQIIDITDPANPSPTASVTDGVGGFEELNGARSADTAVIGGNTYALVAASGDNGLQIIDITDPANPSPTASVTDGVDGFEGLDGAFSVHAVVIGGNTYALVAASGDNGLQIIDITDPANPIATAFVTDGVDGFEGLDGARSVHTAVIGGNTYALVAASTDDGLQIIDITDPANPIATAFVTDGTGGFGVLDGARSVHTAVIGGNTYALVAASGDDGLQIIDITSPASPVPILPYISLNLESGDGARALYSSGTGTDTLTFQYVVRKGDFSAYLAYAGTDALVSPSLAKILDNTDEEETELALPRPGRPNSLSHNKNIVIEVTVGITGVSSPDADGIYEAGDIINVTATFSEAVKAKFNSIRDGSVYGVLDGATSVHTAVIGGNTYALVAATGDDGLQIIDITDPANPSPTASVTDGVGGFDVLGGAFSVDTAVIGGNTYALVAAFLDDGLQIIDITDPANPSPTASVTDGAGGFEVLDDATSVHTTVIGASTYALVSSFGEHGLQIIDITDPAKPSPAASVTDGAGGFGELAGARSVDTAVIGGNTYALVAASGDDGLQIIDITDPAKPSPTASVTDGVDGFEWLDGAFSVHAVVIDGSTYALVAASDDDSLQIIDITDPENPFPTASVTDGVGGFGELAGARSVDTAVIGGNTYALVAASGDNGLQIIDITDPAKPSPAASVTDGVDGFGELAGARSVDTAVIGGNTYALVAATGDDGLQIIDITSPASPALNLLYISLSLESGDGARALYSSGTGTDTLTFQYVVRKGDFSADLAYAGTDALASSGLAKILDNDDEEETELALPMPGQPNSLSHSKDIVIDARPPGSVTWVSSPDNDGTYGVGDIISVTAIFSEAVKVKFNPIKDGSVYGVLGGARSVHTAVIGGNTYALVAATGDDGLQIIDITDPANPSPAASVTDGVGGFGVLGGARSVDTAVIGGNTYALVAARDDDGLQIIDITDPANPSPAASVTDGAGGFGVLDGARSVHTAVIGGNTYALVAAREDDGLQIIDITDPANPSPAASVTDGAGGFGVLDGAFSVDTAVIGGNTYALVAARDDDGIQIIDITDPANPSPTASVTDGVGGFGVLGGAFSVHTAVIGGNTYALVAARDDDGLQIIDITDPANPSPTASVTDGVGGFEELGGAFSVDTAVIGGNTYALVAARDDDGLQIIDITDPANPSPTASVTDGVGGFEELGGAFSVDTAVIGGNTYALVAASGDDGLQIIDITSPASPVPILPYISLNLESGDGARALYSSGTGTDTLTFQYVVRKGDFSADLAYAGTDALVSPSLAKILDNADEEETELALPRPGRIDSLSHNKDIVIDAKITGSATGVSSPDADGTYSTGAIINVTATFSEAVKVKLNPIKDGSAYVVLGGAISVHTAVIGGNTYALVAAREDDGLQIIDITDPANPSPTASVTDGVGGFGVLDGAFSVDTAVIGGNTYALVAARDDDGLQIIDITDPANPSPTASVTDGTGGNDVLVAPRSVDTVEIGGNTYALVAATGDDGIQIIDITDPANPIATASVTDGVGGFGVLDGAFSVDTAVIGGSTYALVAAFIDDGLQVIDITDPANPIATAFVTDGVDRFGVLGGATSVHTVVIDGNTYALVAATGDDGLQIIDITDPANPSPAASVTDGVDGFGVLGGATSVHTVVIDENTYALVAARDDDGLQIIDITDPANPSPTASVTDGVGGFEELDGAFTVTTIVYDNRVYALVAASEDGAVQVIDITNPASPVPILPHISLNLESGNGARALYSSGTGTDTLTFQYVVRKGDFSADLAYAGTDALVSPGLAKIRHNSGSKTGLALPASGQPNSLSHNKDIVIDTGPLGSVTDVSSPDADGTYSTGAIINVTATFSEAVKVKFNSIKDGSVYGVLGGARSVHTAVIGGNTYALVAATGDDGLQIIDITDPANPSPTASVTDGVGGFGVLDGAFFVHTAVIDGNTYALVAARDDDGLQIIDITDPANPSPAASVTDGVDGFRELVGARSVDTAVIGGNTYALVAAFIDDGIQIINITDPANPSPTASVTDGVGGFGGLDGATSVDTAVIDGSTYALVAASGDDGLQVIDITDPANPIATAFVTDGVDRFGVLGGATSVHTVVINENTYALVSSFGDNGLQIIDITDPANPSPAASVTDGVDGFGVLGGATSVHTVVIDENTYALVAARDDDGLQIIDITDPANPSPTASVTDGVGGFEELDGAFTVTTIVYDNRVYALVAASEDGAVQVIDITNPASPVPILPHISLNLESGNGARALYSSGTGTDTLTFQYVVRKGDFSADLAYAGTDALVSPGLAKIRHNSGSKTGLALPASGQPNSLSHNKDIIIDAMKPRILSATVTSSFLVPPRISVVFSENVNTDDLGATWWDISGAGLDGDVTLASNSNPRGTSNTMSLGFGTSLSPFKTTVPDAVLEYAVPAGGTGHVWDGARNSLANQTVVLLDGMNPVQVGTPIAVSATSVRLSFSEALDGNGNGFSLHGTRNRIDVADANVTGTSVTLTLSAPILDTDIAQVRYNGTAGGVVDAAGNALEGFVGRHITKTGITPPAIESARITSPDTIIVTFDEPIYGSNSTNPWSVGGNIPGSSIVSSVVIPGGGANTTTIRLSADYEGTDPEILLRYNSSLGSVADGLGNPLADSEVNIRDGLHPEVESATAISPHEIEVVFTEKIDSFEPVFSISGTADNIVIARLGIERDTRTILLQLVGDIRGTDTPTLGYNSSGGGRIVDPWNNRMASFSGLPIAKTGIDATPPTILDATAVAPGRILVRLSEEAKLAGSVDLSKWSFEGADSALLAVSGVLHPGFEDRIVLILSRNMPDTAPDLSLTYSGGTDGGITDVASNPLSGGTANVKDGMMPAMRTATLRTATEIDMVFTENVTGSTAGFIVSTDSDILGTVQENVEGDTVTLTLSGQAPSHGSLYLRYDPAVGNMTDMNSNRLASFGDRAVMGTAMDPVLPYIVSASAVALDQIDVTFSEPVTGDGTAGVWRLVGRDSREIAVQSATNPNGSYTSTLTLSRNLPDTSPQLILLYTRPETGGISDLASNRLVTSVVHVQDLIPPSIISASVTPPDHITVRLTESVTGSQAGWSVSGLEEGTTTESVLFGGQTVVLMMSSGIPASSLPILVYNSSIGNTQDANANPLASHDLTVDTSKVDGTPPTIQYAVATSPAGITVEFSEPVESGSADGSGWSVNSTYAETLEVISNTDSGGNTMELTLSGNVSDMAPMMNLTYSSSDGTVSDTSSNPLADITVPVQDGLRPEVAQASLRSPSILLVRFTEDVNGWTDSISIENTTGSIELMHDFVDSADSVVFHLGSSVPATDHPTLRYEPRLFFVFDDAYNFLKRIQDFSIDREGYDEVPPTILYANATAPNRIHVEFSKPILLGNSVQSHWTLSGDDASGIGVASIEGEDSGLSASLVLDRNLPDTRPDLALRYSPPSERITDVVFNPLADVDVQVADGLKPELESAATASVRKIALSFGENVTGGSEGFAVSVNDAPLHISSAEGSGTDQLVLVLNATITGTDSVNVSYDGSGGVADESSNLLDGFAATIVDTVGDLTPTEIESATAVAPDTITVTFDGSIWTDSTGGAGWSLTGTDAGSLIITANTDPSGMAAMNLTLSGNLPGTAPEVSLAYARPPSGGVTDGTNQLESVTVPVQDGIEPAIESVQATTSRTIRLNMSETVTSQASGNGGFSLATSGTPLTVTSITGSGTDTLTLVLSGPLPASDVHLSYAAGRDRVRDQSSNQLAAFAARAVATGSDIAPPAISSARAVSPGTVTVTFDKDVDADAADGSHWSLGGTDAGSLTVAANTDPAGSADSMNLTLSGDLPGTRPDLSLTYTRPASGGVTGGASQLETATVTVQDGIEPAIESVQATTSRTIRLNMSETVTSQASGDGGFSLATSGTPPTVTSITGSGTDTLTLVLSGPLPASDVHLSYAAGQDRVRDQSSNQLAAFAARAVATGSDIAPPAISSARAVSPGTVTVTFDKDVDADATDGSHWSLGGAGAGALTVSGNTDPGGAAGIMNLTLSGSLPDTAPELTLTYTRPDSGGVTDGVNQLESVTVNVDDGLAPTVAAARASSGTTVTLTMSEPVLDNSPAPGDFTLGNVASPPAVSSITVSGDAVTLGLSAGLISGESYELSYARTSGSIRDAASNLLANFTGRSVDTSADIVPPTIASALAVTLDTITVTFDESVDADATGGSHWSLGGADAGALTVSGNTDPGDASRIMNLTLSGSLPDTEPALYLIYTRPDSGGVDDGANRLESANVTVSDGIAPTAGSVRATTSREITLVMSEPVTSGASGPGGFTVSAAGTAPTVLSIAASGSTVTLALSGPLPAGAVSLSYDRNAGDVQDAAATRRTRWRAFSDTLAVGTTGDIAPPAIASARCHRIEHDNGHASTGTRGRGRRRRSHWSLGGADAGALTVSGNTDPGGAAGIMNLTLSGNLPGPRPNLR